MRAGVLLAADVSLRFMTAAFVFFSKRLDPLSIKEVAF